MNASDHIADLLAAYDRDAIAKALETAFRRGFEAGGAAVRARAIEALGGAPSFPPNLPPDSQWRIQVSGDEESRRAPRGLTRAIMFKILRQRGALPASELQRLAAREDGRVSEKTVYNELRREKDNLYRELNGIWSLVGDNPVDAANGSQAPTLEGGMA